MLEIRELAIDELDVWVEVANRADGSWPLTAEEVAGRRRTHLLALRHGEPVGAAWFGDADSPVRQGEVLVPPELRRQGTGGRLLGEVRDRLRARGVQGWQVRVSGADPAVLAFLERRGFRETARSQLVELDLARRAPLDRALPEGVVVVDLAERPDLVRGAWEVSLEVVDEAPQAFDPFSGWLAGPGMEPRLQHVALVGQVVAGYAVITRNRARPELAVHSITRVAEAYRRRGLAGALKRAQLAAAAELGVRLLVAENDLRNEPIRRLNQQLGYVRRPDTVTLTCWRWRTSRAEF